MENNKGFSMVELLAVVVIMGVLATISIGAYSRYKDTAARDAYATMSKSASEAAESYFLKNPGETIVTIDTLMKESYLAATKDPKDSGNLCGGAVQKVTTDRNQGTLASNVYIVGIVCTNFRSCLRYPYLSEKDDKLDWSQCASFAGE